MGFESGCIAVVVEVSDLGKIRRFHLIAIMGFLLLVLETHSAGDQWAFG